MNYFINAMDSTYGEHRNDAFMPCFFTTRLLNLDSRKQDEVGFKYSCVKGDFSQRYGTRCPLSFDKLLFVLNQGSHWVSAAIFPKLEIIEVFDSMSRQSSSSNYESLSKALLCWLVLEHQDCQCGRGVVIPENFSLFCQRANQAQQENSFDCGVFSFLTLFR